MKNAQMDLGATVEGHFSREDWEKILEHAQQRLVKNQNVHREWTEEQAWHEVMREFRRERYWGFRPGYKVRKAKRPRNLGVAFIWMTFNALCTFKVAVLWFGQIYSRSDEPKDKWLFFFLIALSLTNFAYFLWRNHAHPD